MTLKCEVLIDTSEQCIYTRSMKYLGIDFGTKKVGIAISDTLGTIAFPKKILKNTHTLYQEINDLIDIEHIEKIVIGKSLDSQGNDNDVQKHITHFIATLSKKTDIGIINQDERGSSIAARSHLYGKGNIANERWTAKANEKKRQHVDAGAAAVILQRYLDTYNRNNGL